MEFIAEVHINLPDSLQGEELEALRTRERARGKELWREGVIKRIWRIPGKKHVLAIYKAANATALQEIFETFPMYQYMDIDVRPLARHALEEEPRADRSGKVGGEPYES